MTDEMLQALDSGGAGGRRQGSASQRLASLILRVALRSLGVGVGVTIVVFGMLRFIPGDPVTALLGDFATQDSIAQMEEQLGLGGTIWDQAVGYFNGLMRADLGKSIVSQVPVNTIIRETILPTASLIALASLVGVVAALPVGTFLALKPRSRWSMLLRQSMTVTLSIPVFFLGLIAILVVALNWELAPVSGFSFEFPEMLYYLWLPALVIVLGNLLPVLARVVEASVRSTLAEEFVEVAFVRGVSRFRFLWHYLLRPSIAPTIALFGYLIVAMMGASVVVELVFNIPGIGLQLIRAVISRDYPVIQGILLVFGMIAVVVSATSDLLAGAVDPRTR